MKCCYIEICIQILLEWDLNIYNSCKKIFENIEYYI